MLLGPVFDSDDFQHAVVKGPKGLEIKSNTVCSFNGIVVSTSDCHPRGPGFNSRLYPKNFSASIGSGTGSTQPRESTLVVQWLSYSPLNPRFAGSIPAGIDGFFQSVKILSMTSFVREEKQWMP